MNIIIPLSIGSIAGGLARFFLGGLIYRFWGSSFPYGTLVVNLTGCFLIGFFYALAEEKLLIGPSARLLLMSGFCGAFTTFSTFMLEISNLLKSGDILRAAIYIIVSLAAGFFLFKTGVFLTKLF